MHARVQLQAVALSMYKLIFMCSVTVNKAWRNIILIFLKLFQIYQRINEAKFSYFKNEEPKSSLKNGENVKNHQMWDKFLDWILLKEL